MSTTHQISNVNGVRDLSIAFDGPGVYVARGQNGAGKTSAINAIRAAHGDKTAHVEPHDGAERGRVSQNGHVLLSVGGRTSSKGAPVLSLVSTGPLATLIDPQVKDRDAAARKRIRAVLEMVPLPGTPEDIAVLTDREPVLAAMLADLGKVDVLSLAETAQTGANEVAVTAERDAAQFNGEVQQLSDLINGAGAVDRSLPAPEAARRDATAAQDAASRARFQADARTSLEKRQEQVRLTLGARPDLAALDLEIQAKEADAAELQRRLQDITAQLSGLRIQRSGVLAQQTAWDESNRILQQPVEGPTQAEAELWESKAREAAARAIEADKLATVASYEERRALSDKAAEVAREKAKRCRAIAKGIPAKLAEIIQRRGVAGLTVDDGRLAVVRDGVTLDFEDRLSFGQKVKLALDIAMAANHGGAQPVLALDPVFWTALDPERKAAIASEAELAGVFILTEEPTDGALRVEKL